MPRTTKNICFIHVHFATKIIRAIMLIHQDTAGLVTRDILADMTELIRNGTKDILNQNQT